jgi:hypothetical protein
MRGLQVWESDATEYLAFGSDAGAMEREPNGRTRSRGRERGVGLMMRRCLLEGVREIS